MMAIDGAYIEDEAQLRSDDEDEDAEPDLRELNACLAALAAVFPDVQIEVFRELLGQFDGESRLALAADALLKSRAEWVKGRWRVPGDGGGGKGGASGGRAEGAAGGNADGERGAATTGDADSVRRAAASGNADGVRRGGGGERGADAVRRVGGGDGREHDGHGDGRNGHDGSLVPKEERFRSEAYKRAVRQLAWREFRGMSRGSVEAVLAEHNYAYLPARRTLVVLAGKSWRVALASLFLRRARPLPAPEDTAAAAAPPPNNNKKKNNDNNNNNENNNHAPNLDYDSLARDQHPLIVWRSTGRGSITPAIRTTGHAQLDADLYATLVRPLKLRLAAQRTAADWRLAVRVNADEAARASATLDCACCFGDVAFEQLAACVACGGVVCFECVRRTVAEALFGQGWARSVDARTGSLVCLAAAGAESCGGHVPADMVRRALLEGDADGGGGSGGGNTGTGTGTGTAANGPDLLQRLDERLAEHSLAAAGVPLVRCPFCPYAEIDDVYLPPTRSPPTLRPDAPYRLAALALVLLTLLLALPPALLALLLLVTTTLHRPMRPKLSQHLANARVRLLRRRVPHRFVCLSPTCARASCLLCRKPWTDPHTCHESALVSLRTHVEQAMSHAIKRVCPRCGTSFVKSSGCNKLTCPCGYKMCYVCRADLSVTGYRHFCEHFRPDADADAPCASCQRCNLWQNEDVDVVLREAREVAERKWRDAQRTRRRGGGGGGGGGGGVDGGDKNGGGDRNDGGDDNDDGGGLSEAELDSLQMRRDEARGVAGLVARVMAGEVPALEDMFDVVVDALYT